MAKPSKDYVPLNIKLDRQVAEILDKFTQKTGITKTAATENALKEYIDKYNKTGKI